MTPATSQQCFSKDLDAPAKFLADLPASPVFPSLYTRKYFDWKIGANPFGYSAACMRYSEGEAAATCSIAAKPGNEALVGKSAVGELGDVHTHASFQRQGHFAAIGRHVIARFEEMAAPRDAIIYGLPNDQALPGWTRKAGCVLLKEMGLSEASRRSWKVPSAWISWLGRPLSRAGRHDYILELEPEAGAAVTAVWEMCDRSRWLLVKDGKWWAWRYRASTESYTTFVLRRRSDGRAEAWAVVKIMPASIPLIRHVIIADILACDAVAERRTLQLLLRQVVRPGDVVRCWLQDGTPLCDLARNAGFAKIREIPVIFAVNAALQALLAKGVLPRMAAGDTDNV